MVIVNLSLNTKYKGSVVMEYEEEIIEMIRNIDNEEMRNAIHKLIMSVKEVV